MNSLKTKVRLGTVKRLLELARALPEFEESLESNLQSWNLELSAVEAKAILQGNSPLLVDFQEREKEKTRHRLASLAESTRGALPFRAGRAPPPGDSSLSGCFRTDLGLFGGMLVLWVRGPPVDGQIRRDREQLVVVEGGA